MSFPGTPVLVVVPAGALHVRIYDHDWYADALGQRAYGPLGRFDQHPAGQPTRYPDLGVSYQTASLRCALAEVFGDARLVAPRRTHRLGVLEATRPLTLVDTRGLAAVELGVPAGALRSRDRTLTQRVARELYDTTEADGLLFEGWHTGEDCLALWERARGAQCLVEDRSLLAVDLLPELLVLAAGLHYLVGDLPA